MRRVLTDKKAILTIAIIAFLILGFTLTLVPNGKSAQAITDMALAEDVGELLLNADGDRVGGMVFNGDTLNKLYNRLCGSEKNTTFSQVQTKYNENKDALKVVTAAKIKSFNAAVDNKYTLVTLGGYKWIVSSMTESDGGDLLVTLWLANSEDADVSAWSYGWKSAGANTAKGYHSNVYGNSYIRAKLLNGYDMPSGADAIVSADYTTSDTNASGNLAKYAPLSDYKYEILVNNQNSKSITDFIVQPKDVYYQGVEKLSTYMSINHAPNEAYLTSGFSNPSQNNRITSPGYANWKYDYLWLPSLSETGFEDGGNVKGVWGISQSELRADKNQSWLRSAAPNGVDYSHIQYIPLPTENLKYNYDESTAQKAIRPAFHLNLTEAHKFASAPTPKQDDGASRKYYVGGNLDFELFNVDSDKVEITEIVFTPAKVLDASGALVDESVTGNMAKPSSLTSGVTRFGASVAGKYVVKCAPKSGYVWVDGSVAPKEYTYKIVYQVGTPSFTGVTSQVYGGKDLEFKFGANFEKDKIKVTPITPGLSHDSTIGTKGGLKAKKAGEYEASFTLTDTDLMEWTGTGGESGGADAKKAKVEITKAPLTLTFEPSAAWSWPNGEDKQVSITDNRFDGDSLYFDFEYKSGSGAPSGLVGAPDDTDAKRTNVTIPALSNGNYTLFVTLTKSGDGENYEISGTSTKTFSVTNRAITLTEADILWNYSNINLDDGEVKQVGTWDNSTIVEVFYTGEDYTFGIDETILSGKGVKLKEYTNRTYRVCGTNYSTSVTLLPLGAGSTVNGGDSVTFTLRWKISQGKYDLRKLRWDYVAGVLEYTGDTQTIELVNPYSTLTAIIRGNTGVDVKSDYEAIINDFVNTDVNFMKPDKNNPDSYIYAEDEEFPWKLTWSIDKAKLNLIWDEVKATDKNGRSYTDYAVNSENSDKIAGYEYYTDDNGSIGTPINKNDIEVIAGQETYYWVKAVLKSNFSANYEIVGGNARAMTLGSNKNEIMVEMPIIEFDYDGEAHGVNGELSVAAGTINIANVIKTYYKGEVRPENKLSEAPTDAGDYIVELSLSESDAQTRYLGVDRIAFKINKVKIKAEWDTSGKIPEISGLDDALKEVVGYIYYDEEGRELDEGAELEAGKKYKVRAVIKESNVENYEFVESDGATILDEPTMTDEKEFEVKKNSNNQGGGINNVEDLEELFKQLPLWQIIVSIISLILTFAFLAKTGGYENRRKRARKKERKYNNVYAAAFLGLSFANWTVMACSLAGVAVLSLVIMLIAMRRCIVAEDDLDDAREEYENNKSEFDRKGRDEDLKLLLMHMLGGNQGNMQSSGIDESSIRGMLNEAVTALLPGMQQMLPQQASGSDELMQKIVEQNEMLMRKLSEQQPTEKIIEREVAASNANDETIKHLLEKSKNDDEKIEKLIKNQEQLIEKISAMSSERIVEKIVEKPVEKIVEVPVERVVEKEVRVEVPVEKVVEKVVEREVKAKAEAKPKKQAAPRLTLEEAYAKLNKTQKRFFDELRAYAMSKDSKCKEKLSTYFTTIGPSSVNPLIKLTIKKNTTVAMFKLEDEYTKDIRRNAGADGTKVKVKETEVIIGDEQAFDTAKEMTDLRVDQIDRYNDYLKEQRAMKRK